jgi:hypothetical protein
MQWLRKNIRRVLGIGGALLLIIGGLIYFAAQLTPCVEIEGQVDGVATKTTADGQNENAIVVDTNFGNNTYGLGLFGDNQPVINQEDNVTAWIDNYSLDIVAITDNGKTYTTDEYTRAINGTKGGSIAGETIAGVGALCILAALVWPLFFKTPKEPGDAVRKEVGSLGAG